MKKLRIFLLLGFFFLDWPFMLGAIPGQDSIRTFFPEGVLPSGQAAVLLWLSPECPVCNRYPTIWKKLANDFPSAHFIGVFTTWEKKKDARRFMRNYSMPFPWFIDEDNRLSRALGVNTTPEVLLLDKRLAIRYRGATDDWFTALGKAAPAPKRHYLALALEALGRGQPILVERTQVVGCLFE